MQRYFISQDCWKGNKVYISGQDAHHIKNVMRNIPNDTIICNHPTGKVAKCKIITVETNDVCVEITEWLDSEKELPIKVTVAQGLPKGDKMELILQKGTELGASGFIPFQAERTVVKWDHKKMEKKMQRYQKIVKEASEQSERNFIPFIDKPLFLPSLIEKSKSYALKLIAYEGEAKTSRPHSLATELEKLDFNQSILVCIGPEGGFSNKEVDLLQANDFVPVRLGPRILRTETAALYLLASVSYHFEEWQH